MNPQETLTRAQDVMAVRRVFGDPIQLEGATVLPVAKIRGGGGGGQGSRAGDEGGGVGFGVSAQAAGVYVIRNGHARWRPAVDVNRIVAGGQLVAITAILVLGPILRRWLASRA
jgi:uncharacterized spore protein YtfJ